MVAALCVLAVATLAATAPPTGAAFTAQTANQGSSIAADVLDPPSGLTATRSCTASAPVLRAVSSATGTQASLVVPVPAGVQAGDVVVAMVMHAVQATPPVAGPGDGWQVATGAPFGAAGASFFGSKVSAGAEPSAYTFTGLTAGQATAAVVVAYAGASWNYPSHQIWLGSGDQVEAHASSAAEQATVVTGFTAVGESAVIAPPAGTNGRAGVVATPAAGPPVALTVSDRTYLAGAGPTVTTAALSTANPSQGFAIVVGPGPGPSPVHLSWGATPDAYASGYEGTRSDVSGWIVAGAGQTVTEYDDATLGAAGARYYLRSVAGSWRSTWVTADVPAC